MFNDDDFWSDDLPEKSIYELLSQYELAKNGASGVFLDEEEYELIIDHFLHNNQEVEALQACDIALTFHPFATELMLYKAEILFQGQKYGQALKALDSLEELEKNVLHALLLRSDIFLAQLKPEMAIALLEERAQYFTGEELVEILHELADIYDEYEDFEAVFATLKRILEIDLKNDEALHKICFWADFTGKNEESKMLHQHIIDEDPYNTLAWFNLGAAFQGLKQYEEAIDAYEYCLAIDEKFESAYRNMADAYMRLRRYDKAIESLQKNLELSKPEDVIFEALGNCFEKQKDFDRARHYYRQAILLNPADDAIFYRIGETYSREHQWEKAMKAYSSALYLNKSNAAYCLAIGNCLLELDAASEALVCFLNAVQLKPNNKSTWMALIKGLYYNRYYDDMLDQITIARENCGDKVEFDYYQSAALFALGKSKEALLYLEKALREAPQRMKVITGLNPDLLQRKPVADLVVKYKKRK